MTILILDGQYSGQRLSNLPKGYRCVAHFDNHPDVATSLLDYDKKTFIADVLVGVEIFTDEATAVRTVESMRRGMLNALAAHIVKLMCETNEMLYDISMEKSK